MVLSIVFASHQEGILMLLGLKMEPLEYAKQALQIANPRIHEHQEQCSIRF